MIIEHAIGPTFPGELSAANLGGGIMWSPTFVTIPDDYPDLDALKAVIAVHDPTKEIPRVIVFPVIDLYRKMTDAEYAAMQAGVASQSPRVQGIFARAVNFTSDAPEWPLLNAMATQLYGAKRAAELLTP